MAWLPASRLLASALCGAIVITLVYRTAGATVVQAVDSSQQDRTAAQQLLLSGASPKDAFAALGGHHGAEFRLVEDAQWIGAESGVAVTADLREKTFWEGVQVLSEQTAYEPVFTPYGRNEQGLPIIWLRRVDVRGEEKPAPAMAAGPLLIRATEARVTVDLRMASLRMAAPQAAVRLELFLEPKAAGALYVTAAALRGFDEENQALRRAEGHDPTTRVEGGTGELFLHLDAVTRIPTDVAKWQAIFRVVESSETTTLAVPVTVVAESRQGELDKLTPAGGARPATAPATRQTSAHELGPYRLSLDAVRLSDAAEAGEAGAPPRIATVQAIFPRGEIDPTTWSRLYGFLIAVPPTLAADQQGPTGWDLKGYAVYAVASADQPDEAATFRVWAQYRAPAGAPDPRWLRWGLPAKSQEVKVPVIWEKSLVIQPRESLPASGPEEQPG